LAQARQKAAAARDLLARGIDPIADQEAAVGPMEEATAKTSADPGGYADATFLPDILEGLKCCIDSNGGDIKTIPRLGTRNLGRDQKGVLDTLRPCGRKIHHRKTIRERLERLFNHAEQNHAFEGRTRRSTTFQRGAYPPQVDGERFTRATPSEIAASSHITAPAG
jgi:hypothetical protein